MRARSLGFALAGVVALAVSGCDLIERRTPGEKIWRKRCAGCHGLDARGNAPRYMGNDRADLSDATWYQGGGDDGSLETVIREGVFAEMPANEKLTREEMRDLIAHLRLLRGERTR
jgi:mono/diheme cytochrome c family protein